MNTVTPAQDLIGRLASLGDENRLRLLVLLERNEFTVSELTSVVQLPQSTVSRHLKVLADDGWTKSRQDGTSRHYRLAPLDDEALELWRVSRRAITDAPWLEEDAERAAAVLDARRRRSEQFFSEAASNWDDLRTDLFGRHVGLAPLFGLLDSRWIVGDLGAGTGALAEAVAPFVKQVVSVDRSPEMLEAARARLAGVGNVDVREGELEELPIEKRTLDVAFLVLVLHYVVDPALVLAEARRVLRPGGRLVIVDMRGHGREEYRETMGHLWPGFSEKQMTEWASAAGFDQYDHTGLKPDPEATGPLLFLGTATR
jgi:SAM-dependent methyltransferase